MQEKVNEVYQPLYPQTYWQQVIGADDQIVTVNNKIDRVQALLASEIRLKQDKDTAITTSNIYSYYRIASGQYNGNGTESQTFNLNFTPLMVYVTPINGSPTLWIPEGSGTGLTYTYGGLATTNAPGLTWRGGHKCVEIVTNGFKVYYSYYSNEFMYANANASGEVYNYFALGKFS